MEASPEESIEVAHGDLVYIVKGKRTKRQRQYLVPTMPSSSSDERVWSSPAAATTSDRELGDSTEEEEDMANCLILLAQSGGKAQVDAGTVPANFDSKRGPDLYECKTCSKCFPSFQALGGHRASHKKPKALQDKEKMVGAVPTEDAGLGLAIGREANMTNLVQQPEGGGGVTSPPAGVKGKVHECSICGSEFTSGQALGGHMRRHRIVSESPEPKKHKRSLFSLDLNLPAPDDSDTATEFAKFRPESNFTTKQPIMFAALVDCHN